MSQDRSKQILIRPDLLEALIDHAEHGITIAEREGGDTILLYVNRAFTEMTGYSEEESLYKDCRFLQGEERDQVEIDKIHDAINNEKSVRVVLKNFKKNGEMFWNDLTITPYFDEQDGIMYYIGIQKDISEFVELGRKLEQTKIDNA